MPGTHICLQTYVLFYQALTGIGGGEAGVFASTLAGAVPAPAHLDPLSSPCPAEMADKVRYACESPLSDCVRDKV